MAYQTFRQGIKDCIPTLLGYAGIGFSFGVVGSTSGFNLFEIALLSILIYAGAAQFIVIALMAVHTPVWVIVLTTLIVNSRMFLLSMTLAPSFKSETLGHRVGIGALLTDETFGVAITPYSKGEMIGRNWMHGLNITAYLFWIFTTILGAALGDFVSRPEMFGLDYAILAMFVFLAAAQLEGVQKSKIRLYMLLICVVTVLMLVLSLFMPSYLAIMIASILTATLGMVMEQ
ncbi:MULTISPECIES: AzlC family ABC transporter permease [unclassified Staphylococcus]|uniref:AzlC family ABC transporter permease n=1 Tax=unclassified Staphylococcus TaxID=91994 RepID=UPI0021D23506|nr:MULTISPECIES: AzlC family ABC transporter permease [unclassified Staphylococcus]UXR78353.1 AzlC family ABC transporter permease [Staphylococcus sp. IVB6227]UXR82518.1 AzlC family ABC transporter permease [Staphylococcus sp. IVB6214]